MAPQVWTFGGADESCLMTCEGVFCVRLRENAPYDGDNDAVRKELGRSGASSTTTKFRSEPKNCPCIKLPHPEKLRFSSRASCMVMRPQS